MRILYRISDAGYSKIKPKFINNELCLKNAISVFPIDQYSWHLIADNTSSETDSMIHKYVPKDCITRVSIGHGAGTFNIALDYALEYDDNELVYFLENDYLHKQRAAEVLKDVFEAVSPNYATLYDHPDKYISSLKGGNLYIEEDGGELTKLYLAGNCHWKLTNSTTMTFASTVKILKEDENILRRHTNVGHYPQDFKMFLELREKGRTLVSSVPGHATHGESAWLSPLTDWSKV